jgi:two-component sensor histidine kinase
VVIDIAIPFGMVLNELITNTFKYAFPDKKPGVISISLKKIETDEIDFNYSDDGIGFKDDVIILDQKSLGIQTILSIIREQMQGDIQCMPGKGLHYHIRFKDNIYHERI